QRERPLPDAPGRESEFLGQPGIRRPGADGAGAGVRSGSGHLSLSPSVRSRGSRCGRPEAAGLAGLARLGTLLGLVLLVSLFLLIVLVLLVALFLVVSLVLLVALVRLVLRLLAVRLLAFGPGACVVRLPCRAGRGCGHLAVRSRRVWLARSLIFLKAGQ